MSRPHRLSGAAWAGMRVGLLGGSFNPAHDGHRTISLLALRLLRLDQVWWLVSPQNPLKSPAEMAALSLRLAAAQKVAAHPQITASALESDLKTRYTADTLAELRRRYPRTRFVWLMGADNLIQLRRWQRWRKIFASTPLAVFSRSPYSLRALGSVAARCYQRQRRPERRAAVLAEQRPPAWVFFRNPWHPASASEIRRRNARPFDQLLGAP